MCAVLAGIIGFLVGHVHSRENPVAPSAGSVAPISQPSVVGSRGLPPVPLAVTIEGPSIVLRDEDTHYEAVVTGGDGGPYSYEWTLNDVTTAPRDHPYFSFGMQASPSGRIMPMSVTVTSGRSGESATTSMQFTYYDALPVEAPSNETLGTFLFQRTPEGKYMFVQEELSRLYGFKIRATTGTLGASLSVKKVKVRIDGIERKK